MAFRSTPERSLCFQASEVAGARCTRLGVRGSAPPVLTAVAALLPRECAPCARGRLEAWKQKKRKWVRTPGTARHPAAGASHPPRCEGSQAAPTVPTGRLGGRSAFAAMASHRALLLVSLILAVLASAAAFRLPFFTSPKADADLEVVENVLASVGARAFWRVNVVAAFRLGGAAPRQTVRCDLLFRLPTRRQVAQALRDGGREEAPPEYCQGQPAENQGPQCKEPLVAHGA